jgi:hypothetical protein
MNMVKWKYLLDTNMPKGKSHIVRDNDDSTEDWNSQRKTWQENNDAIGAFLGFDGGFKEITEEEANSIIAQYH